jgi:hypothetical protein
MSILRQHAYFHPQLSPMAHFRVLLFVLLHCATAGAWAQFHPQYLPGQQLTPLLYGQGQSRISVAAQAGTTTFDALYEEPIRGFHLDAAHALNGRWGLVGALGVHDMDVRTEIRMYYGSGAAPRITTFRDRGRWAYGELGGGQYRIFSGNWIGEVYGLLGYGSTWNEWADGWWTRSRLYGVTAQANIGRASGFFEWAFANRLRYFTISSIQAPFVQPDNWRGFELELMGQGPFLVWEPALVVRGGWKQVRISFQAGFSGDVLGTMPERADLNVGLGLNLFLPGRSPADRP